MVVIIIESGNIGRKTGSGREMEMMKFSFGHFEFEGLVGHLSRVVQTWLGMWV